jgi:hypothetical protein
LYDGFWFLSGPAIGVALVLAGAGWMSTILPVYLALNSGHLLAPIALAWSNAELRQKMMLRRRKYIWLPVAIVAFGVAAGIFVGKTFPVNHLTLSLRVTDGIDYLRPLIALLPLYFAWNAYHFGMQNYGFMRLYFPALDRSTAMQWAMFGSLFGLIIIPVVFRQDWVRLFCLGAVMFNHQIAALGISSHAWSRHRGRNPLWFAGTLIAVGSLLAWLILHAPEWILMTVVGTRITVGFVHFLYDRWVPWQKLLSQGGAHEARIYRFSRNQTALEGGPMR